MQTGEAGHESEINQLNNINITVLYFLLGWNWGSFEVFPIFLSDILWLDFSGLFNSC